MSTLLFLALLGLAPCARAYTLSIPADTLQTLDGFGVSAAWSGEEILGLPDTERERVLRQLFTDEGAALSIVRIRLVPAGSEFDNQVRFCLQAKAKGVARFFATIWEVPGPFLDGSQKLLPARFGEYARAVADFVRDMEAKGIPIGWIGVQNEPDNGPKLASGWTVDYNKYTVHFYRSKAELRDFSVALKAELRARGMSGVKLLGPECMGWEGTRELIKAQFESAAGIDALDIVATHDYWGAERDADMNPVRAEVADLAKARGKRIWETEYSRFDCLSGCTDPCQQSHVAQDPVRLMSEADYDMQDGLDMVQYVYRDLALANASAWLYWWTHNPNKGCGNLAQGQAGMHNSFNGLTLIKADNTFYFPKRFHTLSHYMRFLRPGSVRLKLATDGEDAIRPLAFRDSTGEKVIVVLSNRGAASAPVTVTLPGFASHTAVKAYVTTQGADHNLVAGPTESFAAASGYSLQAPARSVMTLIFERPAPTAAPARSGASGDPRISRSDPRAIRYEAAAGEKVLLEARTLQGRTVFRAERVHGTSGRHEFAWPSAGPGPWVASVTYVRTGRAYRLLFLDPSPR
jgi:O-glycosyl hydrolase